MVANSAVEAMHFRSRSIWVLGVILSAAGCGGPHEAQATELTVVTDAEKIESVVTNLGYTVNLEEARMVGKNMTFALAGELLTRGVLRRAYDWVVPDALAHAGHYSGGDITGQLDGRLVFDWLPGKHKTLGTATLLAGSYKSANFAFTKALESDGLAADDDLLDHSALFRGQVEWDTNSIEFLALIDIDEDTQLIGMPFEDDVDPASTQRLHVELQTSVDTVGETLFDGVDFASLDADGDRQVRIDGSATTKPAIDAYLALSRAVATHDYYKIVATH